MKSRRFRTVFDPSYEKLVNVFLSDEEMLKLLPFQKYKFLGLETVNATTVKRKFLLNKDTIKIPRMFESKIKPEYLEWKETIIFNKDNKSGMFSIQPNIPQNFRSKVLCHGEFEFVTLKDNKTERNLNLTVKVDVPFIGSLIESEVLDQVWLLFHHEEEVINEFYLIFHEQKTHGFMP